jgi:ketosteroid isomerase-like protein
VVSQENVEIMRRAYDAFNRGDLEWLDSFEGLHADIEDYIDAEGDRVFTWARWTGRGRGSGIDAEWWLATVFTLRDGRVIRAEEFFDRTEALEAVGLSE